MQNVSFTAIIKHAAGLWWNCIDSSQVSVSWTQKHHSCVWWMGNDGKSFCTLWAYTKQRWSFSHRIRLSFWLLLLVLQGSKLTRASGPMPGKIRFGPQKLSQWGPGGPQKKKNHLLEVSALLSVSYPRRRCDQQANLSYITLPVVPHQMVAWKFEVRAKKNLYIICKQLLFSYTKSNVEFTWKQNGGPRASLFHYHKFNEMKLNRTYRWSKGKKNKKEHRQWKLC